MTGEQRWSLRFVFENPPRDIEYNAVVQGPEIGPHDASVEVVPAALLEQARKRAAQYEADHLYVEEAQADLEQAREALRDIKELSLVAGLPDSSNRNLSRVGSIARQALASGAVAAGAGEGDG